MGGSVILDDRTKGTVTAARRPLAFPHNGTSALCVRGEINTGGQSYEVLQPASPDDSPIALVLLDDAGGMVSVEPMLLTGKGFVVKHYGIGFVDILGSFDRMPNLAQLGAIVGGSDVRGATIRSTTIFTPDGKSTIEINPKTLK